MNAPPMPEDGPGEIRAVTHSDSVDSGQKSPCLTLSDHERWLEHALGAAVAVEFVRVAASPDPGVTAAYANRVVSNSRALAAGDPKLHLSLLRSQVRWLRGLRVGSRELQW
jgi:hypothetical protein